MQIGSLGQVIDPLEKGLLRDLEQDKPLSTHVAHESMPIQVPRMHLAGWQLGQLRKGGRLNVGIMISDSFWYSLSDNGRAMKDSSIDNLETDFLDGNLDALKNRDCPVCGDAGKLRFDVSRGRSVGLEPGRRYPSSMTIYCLGKCNYMISHLDGFCPEWAEGIDDWQGFSENLSNRMGGGDG